MTELPPDLRKLLPKALDVLRFLGTQPAGASVDTIIAGTGLSARGCRKAIRRLVTRYYLEMPEREYYTLSKRGQEAVQTLREFDEASATTEPSAPPTESASPAPIGESAPPAPEAEAAPPSPSPTADVASTAEPSASPTTESAPPVPEAEAAPPSPSPMADVASTAEPTRPQPNHARRLSVFLPKALAMGLPAKLQVGFGAPLAESAPLRQPARLVLRLSVPNCDVQPAEHTLEIANEDGAVGPLGFRVEAQRVGTVHVTLAVYQQLSAEELLPLGGMFFDLDVTDFPTPASAALHALAVVVRMYEGESA